MKIYLIVAAGGALGAMARYGTDSMVNRWAGLGFPWGTVTVNLVGSLVLGLLIGAAVHGLHLGQEMRALIVTGFLGAFTTFSTFSLETVELMSGGRVAAGLANAALSVAGCLVAASVGLAVGSRITA